MLAGVELDAVVQVEHCFKININLYNKTEDGVGSVLRQSLGKFQTSMNLNEFKGHLSYIGNFANYANKFECNKSEKIFRSRQDYKRHLPTCPIVVMHSYPGGYFKLPKTVFELLEENDIYFTHILLHTILRL